MKQISLTILISVLGFLLTGGCSNPVKNEVNRPEVQWNGKTVTSEEIVSDTIVTCTGDIIINNGGSLTIDNVLLYMKDSAYGIYVEPGGELLINNNSKITVENPETEHYEFWYKHGSSGQILNSTVEYTWTPDPGGKSQFNEAGMFIEADNFEMRNSTIQYSLGNGIEAYQADSLNIVDSEFLENGANGILVRNSTGLSLTGCTISNNGKDTERHDGCGFIVLVVTGSIESCTIESNRFTGFEGSGDMNLNISNCNIKNNSDFGIFIHDEFSSSLVEIASNTVENNANISQIHAGISVEGGVKAYVHDNILDQNYTGIRVLNNTPTSNFEYNEIHNCSTWGIHVDNSSPVFYHNQVSRCNWVAFVQEENGTPHPNFGDTTVEKSGYNDFSNNNNGIRNDSTVELKAENNYWGSTEGNIIDLYNFSDDTPIDYDPWLSSQP